MELEGTTLGHYLLQRRLARGGMSEVYLAYDQSIQRTVAIKVVNRYRDDHMQRIQNEVKVLGMLSHPHILPALDYGEEGRATNRKGEEAPLLRGVVRFPWAQGGPNGYNNGLGVSPRGDVIASISGAPAPTRIGNQIFVQATMTKMIAHCTQGGETIDKATPPTLVTAAPEEEAA